MDVLFELSNFRFGSSMMQHVAENVEEMQALSFCARFRCILTFEGFR